RVDEGVNENAFLVPQAGVTHDAQGHPTALVVGADRKVQLRTLQVAGTQGDSWIVEGGLADGDRVIVSGVQRVQPGVTVAATEAGTTAAVGSLPAVPAVATKNTAPPAIVASARPEPRHTASAQAKKAGEI